MSANSKIEWTEKTWNPIAAFLKYNLLRDAKTGTTIRLSDSDNEETVAGRGVFIPKGTRGWFCVKVSPGCANCYAEGINIRLGNGLEYLHRNLDDIEFRLVNLEDPLKWKKPCMVFVNSMTDLFLEHIPFPMVMKVWSIMGMATRHTFQVLTKRPERLLEFYNWNYPPNLISRAEAEKDWLGSYGHIWLGTSVEDQIRADKRIHVLLRTPAAIRFLSCEPLLGPINLKEWLDIVNREFEPLHWIIVGGESGPRARPCAIEWIRGIVAQCKAATVPVFVKQLGAQPTRDNMYFPPGAIRDRKGGDPDEWPEDLRVREFPKLKAA